jgi:hypothetical protein
MDMPRVARYFNQHSIFFSASDVLRFGKIIARTSL